MCNSLRVGRRSAGCCSVVLRARQLPHQSVAILVRPPACRLRPCHSSKQLESSASSSSSSDSSSASVQRYIRARSPHHAHSAMVAQAAKQHSYHQPRLASAQLIIHSPHSNPTTPSPHPSALSSSSSYSSLTSLNPSPSPEPVSPPLPTSPAPPATTHRCPYPQPPTSHPTHPTSQATTTAPS